MNSSSSINIISNNKTRSVFTSKIQMTIITIMMMMMTMIVMLLLLPVASGFILRPSSLSTTMTTTSPSSIIMMMSLRHHSSNNIKIQQQQQQQQQRWNSIIRIPNNHRKVTLFPSSISSSSSSSSSLVLYNSMNKSNDNASSSSLNNDDTILSNRFDKTNIMYGILWIILVTLAFTNNNPIIPSGPIVEQTDALLLQLIIDNPQHPQNLNELYYLVFNLFAIVPILLANLLLPIHEMIITQSSNIDDITTTSSIDDDDKNTNKLKLLPSIIPPQPFILASAAIGYFAMGLYLSLRSPPSLLQTLPQQKLPPPSQSSKNLFQFLQPKSPIEENPPPTMIMEWSWYTKNIWENKIVQWFSVFFILYLPFGSDTVAVLQSSSDGFKTLIDGYTELFTTSRFVAVSSLDLLLLHITCTILIPYDYIYRSTQYAKAMSSLSENDNIDNIQERGRQIAILASLFPYIGTALYIALRPSLLQEEDNN